ncbi:protein TolQ [Halopseudomonas sp. SMJS2]|uniref:protein TolQ n=1 Tax=Halopseudomonas sp. SMJS2 TaxID=3041098 RepID=UPI002452A37C|nr:protein TolQ [Halopseudomonas sp. SMJS2]WGK61812.1 protein TolQ [Halopseudomonas sp. SMJS2]
MPTSTTHSMSPWTLVAEASLLVQGVMLILVLASLISWFLIIQRSSLMGTAKRSLTRFERSFWSKDTDLQQLYQQQQPDSPGVEGVFHAGYSEFAHMRAQQSDPDAVMEGVQRAMRVAISQEEERLEKNLPFLATVGSVSPYIGLFGTVWGIMNSFIGLSQSEQATLSAVAPGIAEALIATAIGLFAAIPAVIAYNRFAARSEGLISRYYTFAEQFSTLLHRRLHSRAEQ